MKNPKYLLVAAVTEGEIFGTPEVVPFDEFEEFQRRASDATDNAGGYKVLAEIDGYYQTISKTVSDCDNKLCSFYTHYLVHYSEESGRMLEHEAFHAAEDQCEAAQNAYIGFMDKHQDESIPIPEILERRAAFWEKRICA